MAANSEKPIAATAAAPVSAQPVSDMHAQAIAYFANRHRFRLLEALPWVLAIAAFFAFPDRLTFGSQVLLMMLFALSLDLILGYAGIVTLGHAAFFGIGAYTVGLTRGRLGWSEPICAPRRGGRRRRGGGRGIGRAPAALSRPDAARC